MYEPVWMLLFSMAKGLAVGLIDMADPMSSISEKKRTLSAAIGLCQLVGQNPRHRVSRGDPVNSLVTLALVFGRVI